MPGLDVYGGLSGLGCALFGLLAAGSINRQAGYGNRVQALIRLLLYLCLPAKIICELTTGTTIFVSNTRSGMVGVPLAHLVGGIAGSLTATKTKGQGIAKKLNL